MALRRWGAGVAVGVGLSFLPVGPFVVDPAHSAVEFFVTDNRGGFAGTARDVRVAAQVREQDGTFVADVDVRIDARAVSTGSTLRDGQMHHDFLMSDRYPTITFRGTVVPTGSIAALSFSATVTGRLTIKDTTREIAFPVQVIALRDSYLVQGKTTLRMTDFGIPIPRFLIFAAEDPVAVTLRLQLGAPP